MRRHLDAGKYSTWEGLEADLDLMFVNCMTFNPAGEGGAGRGTQELRSLSGGGGAADSGAEDCQSRVELLQQLDALLPVSCQAVPAYCLFQEAPLPCMCPHRMHPPHCCLLPLSASIWHMEAKKMQEISRKMIACGRQGLTNFRGRTAGIVRSHDAQINAEVSAASSGSRTLHISVV